MMEPGQAFYNALNQGVYENKFPNRWKDFDKDVKTRWAKAEKIYEQTEN